MNNDMVKNGYVEWISSSLKGGDLSWAFRGKDFPARLNDEVKSVNHMKEKVLQSKRVKNAIAIEMQKTNNMSEKDLEDQCETIVNIMGNDMQLWVIRFIGYSVAKIVKTVFSGIYVNIQQLREIREYIKNDPVILMPTHKTYMDFILISLLCFDQDIPLPSIAAAMDFMNSYFLAETIRRCGAFFIRRNIGKDDLYWAILTEYVHTVLLKSNHPLEFFIEGTRSRTGKSLYPKLGLLQLALEPFLLGHVHDTIIFPITINYDKILEESLYAYELCGFPKPKESTKGLFEARKILSKRFGNVYVTVGKPISVRKFFGPSVHRLSSYKTDFSMEVIPEDLALVKKLGYTIVDQHNTNNVITLWPYICTIILQIHQEKRISSQSENFTFNEILAHLRELLCVASRLEAAVHIQKDVESDLEAFLELNQDLLAREDVDENVEPCFRLKKWQIADNSDTIYMDMLKDCITQIILSNYAGQMVYNFVSVSLASLVLLHKKQHIIDDMSNCFGYLLDIFEYEFVGKLREKNDTFIDAVQKLQSSLAVSKMNSMIVIECEKDLKVLADLTLPLIVVYQLVLQILCAFAGSRITQRLIIDGCRRRLIRLYQHPSYRFLRLSGLSASPIKNAIQSLVKRNALIKQPDESYIVSSTEIFSISDFLHSVTPYDLQLKSVLSCKV